MAPGASIVVLCATPDPANFYDDIPQGMATLAGLPGMSVVSSSYGVDLEYAGLGSVESAFENSYLAPAAAANPNVTFFASSGDSGAAYGLIYPSSSPTVVSVGGTSLYLNAKNQWQSETGWGNGDLSPFFGGSGGGISTEFAEPTYQQDDGFDSGGFRTNPDVSADANPATGVAVYDPFDLAPRPPGARPAAPACRPRCGPAWPRLPIRAVSLNGASPWFNPDPDRPL